MSKSLYLVGIKIKFPIALAPLTEMIIIMVIIIESTVTVIVPVVMPVPFVMPVIKMLH